MISDIFMLYGSFYGLKLLKVENEASKPMATLLGEVYSKTRESLMSYIEAENMPNFLLLKLIWQIAPILNSECKLDCLNRDAAQNSTSYEGNSFQQYMGLCFNNDIYYQLAKGLIHPDILEMVSNQKVLPQSPLIAPSMFLK